MPFKSKSQKAIPYQLNNPGEKGNGYQKGPWCLFDRVDNPGDRETWTGAPQLTRFLLRSGEGSGGKGGSASLTDDFIPDSRHWRPITPGRGPDICHWTWRKGGIMKNILGSFAGLLFVVTGFVADAAFLDVPIGYPTIQAAVNYAEEGDTIRLSHGTYQENIVVDVNRNIIIEGGWNDNFTERDMNPALTRLDPGNASGMSGITLDAGSGETIFVVIRGLTIQDGATSTGGGLSMVAQSGGSASLTLEGSQILRNGAGLGGGIHYLASGGTVTSTIINTLIAGNQAQAGGSGGGIYCESRNVGNLQVTLMNDTITGNEGNQAGGGLYVEAQDTSLAHITFTNTILWGNTSPGLPSAGPELYMVRDVGAQLTVNTSFSNIRTAGLSVQSGSYNALGGNIDGDPLFRNVQEMDYHLAEGSPCIEQGTAANAPEDDFEGNPRPFGTGADIGADEVTPEELVFRTRVLSGMQDGTLTSYGGSIGVDISVGDLGGTGVDRGFVSFPLSSMPSGSIIGSAVLRMYQHTVNFAPYTDLGTVVVDHMEYGPHLTFEVYDLPTLQDNIGILSCGADIGWKEMDVTASVGNDLDAGRSLSQFRLRFSPIENDMDGDSDKANFEASGAVSGLGNVAQLIVTYLEGEETVLPVPTAQEGPWEYGSVEHPEASPEPELSRPFAVGNLAGGFLDLQAGFPVFSGPVDVYLGICAPAISPDLYLVTPDHGLKPVTQGLARWRTNTGEPVEESLFG
ncbi:MAG: hypothetical protein JRI27_06055, partial [Deltaproteobacteria bacterium]|nr:hypothetical protein [Deltaproteobacteria bacterium]